MSTLLAAGADIFGLAGWVWAASDRQVPSVITRARNRPRWPEAVLFKSSSGTITRADVRTENNKPCGEHNERYCGRNQQKANVRHKDNLVPNRSRTTRAIVAKALLLSRCSCRERGASREIAAPTPSRPSQKRWRSQTLPPRKQCRRRATWSAPLTQVPPPPSKTQK